MFVGSATIPLYTQLAASFLTYCQQQLCVCVLFGLVLSAEGIMANGCFVFSKSSTAVVVLCAD